MNKILLSLIACCCLLYGYSQSGHSSPKAPSASEGHQIRLSLQPYKSGKAYLGYYYGKIKALADSTMLDANGAGVFAGKEPLPGGVYFIVSPNRTILFELLIDAQQHFAIAADTAHIPASVVFTGSADNTVFQNYTRLTTSKGSEIVAAQQELATVHSHADTVRLQEKIRKLNVEIQDYREDLSTKYPRSLLVTLFHVMKDPVVPPAAQQPGGKYDSVFAYRFFKSHFWDGVSFTDDRLTRTPVFEPRLDKYYRDLVSPQVDSIEREVDWMLLQARVSKPLFQYLMVYFVQKYINPVYMGQDAVFVHIFEKYINTGQADFFTEKYRKFIDNRAYSLMANQIGQAAPDLAMVDSAGKPRTLYEVSAPFTVLCFWDPTCGHCKEIVPEVDSIFKAKWKSNGVKIFGVMVDGGRDLWVQFIKDHNLTDWIHVYETKEHQQETEAAGKPGYRQLYDVYQTPILYLLDKDKHIIAKKLSYQQIDEVMNLKMQHAKSN